MTETNIGMGSINKQNETYKRLKDQGLSGVKALKTIVNKPSYDKAPKTFRLADVARLLDIPRTTIRDHEKNADINYQDNNDSKQGKQEYTLQDILTLRDYFKKGFFAGSTKRPPELDPIVISMAMFKGGVGKTTHATHLAAHCAIKGLKTLIIDLDPQASATLTLGYLPSIDLFEGNTILGSLTEDFQQIKEIILPTHYHGLDIITAGLELQGADLILPNPNANNASKLGPALLRLKKALSLIPEYDVIILDCPPNHGATTMNALTASDGIILPVTPSMLAYGSSIQFIQTLEELSEILKSYQQTEKSSLNNEDFNIINSLENKLFRILITNDEGNKEHQDATAAIRQLYKEYVLPRPMIHSIALPRTSNDLALLYDMKRSSLRGSKEAFDRGISCMKEVNDDVLTLLSFIWGIDK